MEEVVAVKEVVQLNGDDTDDEFSCLTVKSLQPAARLV